MNSARRATPDSEAVASSEDERPWPVATPFGALPRADGNVPVLGGGGGIWGSQRRGSFKLSETAHRNAAREARLGAVNPGGLMPGTTPSPSTTATSDTTGSLPFTIPLQPAPKAGRSLSHSHGQRDHVHSAFGQAAADHALPLGLLAEEGDTETDSDYEGPALSHTASHPPIGTLHRIQTLPTNYSTHHQSHHHQHHDNSGSDDFSTTLRPERRLDADFANLSLEIAAHQRQRAQWQSHLGWDDLPNTNESRRHSLADIPTRRGSLDDDSSPLNLSGFLGDARSQKQAPQLQQTARNLAHLQSINNRRVSEAAIMRYNESSNGVDFHIPPQYKVPFVAIDDIDRATSGNHNQIATMRGQFMPGAYRAARRQLYIVSFKCSRVDVFYLLEDTGLVVQEGDIVIVEADRGQDLGTVQHANVTQDQAKALKKKYSEELYKWLMMFSRNNTSASVNPNAQPQPQGTATDAGPGLLANAPPTMQGLPRDNHNSLKPKAIKRLALAHEIKMLAEKEGNEAKAKRACQQKVAHLNLQMEILDAEWQWDFQKLIFYYYADHYINFKDLITDLYRIYKTRIWLSAVNPASFSQHAMGQPPSGFGPGAIVGTGHLGQGMSNSYAMAYGPDPDPYGAIPPYRIAGYDSVNPNLSYGGAPNWPTNPSNPSNFPATEPGVFPSGTHMDHHPFYDHTGRNAHVPTVLSAERGPILDSPPFNSAASISPAGFSSQVAPPQPGLNGRHNSHSNNLWGNSPTHHPSNAGRPMEMQQPLGARPGSNGSVPASASNGLQHPFGYGFGGGDMRQSGNRQDVTFGQRAGGQGPLAFGSYGAITSPTGSKQTNSRARVSNYLSGLPDTPGANQK